MINCWKNVPREVVSPAFSVLKELAFWKLCFSEKRAFALYREVAETQEPGTRMKVQRGGQRSFGPVFTVCVLASSLLSWCVNINARDMFFYRGFETVERFCDEGIWGIAEAAALSVRRCWGSRVGGRKETTRPSRAQMLFLDDCCHPVWDV